MYQASSYGGAPAGESPVPGGSSGQGSSSGLESRTIKGHTVKYETSSHNSLGAHFLDKISSSDAEVIFHDAKNHDHSVEFKDTDDNYHFKLKYMGDYYLLKFYY